MELSWFVLYGPEQTGATIKPILYSHDMTLQISILPRHLATVDVNSKPGFH